MKKNLFILILAIFSLSSSVQSTCNNIYPVVSPDGQHLYFSSDRQGSNYEIYRSDLDGVSNLMRLTNTSTNNYYPAISPDGSKILFQSGDYGASAEVFIMNADGSGLTQLTSNSVYDGNPNFSPDGQKIVFDGWDNDSYPEIFTMDVNGINRTQLTNVGGAYWQYSPIYNPAGTYIYFSLGYNADNHLARMNLDGSNIIDITPPNGFGYAEFGMHFSPDGSHIIFSTTEWLGYNNGSDIVIADTLGNNWNRITNAAAGEYMYCPFWNPGNNKIYYGHYTAASPYWEIYKMDTTGTGAVLLTDCTAVGVQENIAKENTINVYPVPAKSELNLLMPEGFYAEMLDVAGRFILSTADNKVDISKLNNGFYTIRFFDRNKKLMQTSKVIKN